MTAILGLCAFSRDAAAALVVDGEVVAAVREECLTRRKRDHELPLHAIEYCLGEAGLSPEQLDYVGFSGKPLLEFDRVIETFLARAPAGFVSFREALPTWLRQKLHLPREAGRALRHGYRKRFVFAERPESQAAGAFFPSPFPEAAILVLDEGGEWATGAYGLGRANRIELTHEQRFPHSLRVLRSALASFAGFPLPGGGGELMELASRGEPRYADRLLDTLIDLKPDGSFRLELSCFDDLDGRAATSRRLPALFGAPPRRPDDPVRELDLDLAASLRRIAEEVMVRTARHVRAETGMRDACVAGGIAATDAAGVLREGPFERVWVQPAAGDAGGAPGIALLIWHQLLDGARRPGHAQRGSLLGPAFADEEIGRFLTGTGAAFEKIGDDDSLCERVAAALAAGQVVGWFQGRLGFGALPSGTRSVLADPRDPRMPARLNLKVGFCEDSRPLALSVLAEHARESTIPHCTGAPVRAVDPGGHPLFRRLLEAFHRLTGCAALLDTGLNLDGEPLASAPRDAYQVFMASGIDLLAMGRHLLSKAAQPAHVGEAGPRERDLVLDGLLRHPGTGATLRMEGDRAVGEPGGEAFERKEGIWRMFWPHEGMAGPSDVTRAVQSFYEETPFPNYEEHDSLRSLVEKSRRGRYARALDRAIPYNATVLEVGCGTGQLTNFLGISCRRAVGTDICLSSLRLGERFRVAHDLRRVRFVQMNLFRPCFAPRAFDVILCNGVLHHTSDPYGGFQVLLSLLKPGGHLVVGLYNRYGRLATDLRRALFRLSGGRGQWIDPVLRRGLGSPEQRRAWFHDQYRHPHESKHTIGEVLDWFDRGGLRFVRGVPLATPEADPLDEAGLFEPRPRGKALDHFLVQAGQVITGSREGGFFLMIGRRPEASSVTRP